MEIGKINQSVVPTAKLNVCDIKFVTAYPDGII